VDKIKKILVVEDDYVIRKIFKEILTDYYTIELAEDANDAFDRLKNYTPDLMIVDIMMPGMNGLDMVKKIRGDKKFHKSIIIIITALNDAETRKNAFKSGADEVIIKPFDIVELKTKVQLMFRLQNRLLEGCNDSLKQ
jgi:DNA-binding response OmpR family regulator